MSKQCNGQIVTQCDKNNTYIQWPAYPGERLDSSVAVVGWDCEMAKTNGMVYLSTDSETELETLSYIYSHISTEGKYCTSVTYTLDLPSSIDLSSPQGGNNNYHNVTVSDHCEH